MKQIGEKDYALSFVADSRKLYKIGVSFDTETRKLVDWKVMEWLEDRNFRLTVFSKV